MFSAEHAIHDQDYNSTILLVCCLQTVDISQDEILINVKTYIYCFVVRFSTHYSICYIYITFIAMLNIPLPLLYSPT